MQIKKNSQGCKTFAFIYPLLFFFYLPHLDIERFKGVKKMGKKHLTEKDRYALEKMLKKGMRVKEIAKILDFSLVTIYAEKKRGTIEQLDSNLNKYFIYLADAGQLEREKKKEHMGRPKKLKEDDEMLKEFRHYVIDMKFSPEAFVCKTGCKKVCVKTLYNYVHEEYIKGVETNNLPYATKKKKKKNPLAKRKYSSGKSIEERPKDILKRDTFGHWELDTVYSSKDDLSCLVVLTERMTRKEIIEKVKDRTSTSIIKAINKIEKRVGAPQFRKTFKTITCDNGVEFSNWEEIEKSCLNKGTRTSLYFCHPYCSGERGTNENNNKLIRRWLPKGDDIGLYSPKEIKQIEEWMNNYPRKIFGGLSANEYFELLQCETIA